MRLSGLHQYFFLFMLILMDTLLLWIKMPVKQLTFIIALMVLTNIFAADFGESMSSDGNDPLSARQSYANLASLIDGETTNDSFYDQLIQAANIAPADRMMIWAEVFFPLFNDVFTRYASIQTLCNGAFHLIEMQTGTIEVTELTKGRVRDVAEKLDGVTRLQNNRLNNCADALAKWVSDWAMTENASA